ncbi:cytochrome b/b6 domain-containing protein [Mesorhizobium sp. BAC0120]|uniref:cytochrome b n=1 Tax=Mesorhizobium sp. BAC0120 TaxID=3090670 RepID=UPI00298C5AB1|nr:cytochrome b/b6 domain-containing protein [Mesorhizobium sp. BAC0120]MDW6021753.1 cytochrome b/b6 domain-containing protein [Mesorhizobium sp. BAC0120]
MPIAGKTGYSPTQILLHWVIAALVLFQLVFGDSIGHVLRAAKRGRAVSAADVTLGTLHYWVGLVILALVAVRIAVRFSSGAPAPVATNGPAWLAEAARFSHGLFYVLLVATPILGLLGYYFGDPFGDIHSLAKPVFIILISVHAAAALFHQFWLRDGTLARMILPARRRAEATREFAREPGR